MIFEKMNKVLYGLTISDLFHNFISLNISHIFLICEFNFLAKFFVPVVLKLLILVKVKLFCSSISFRIFSIQKEFQKSLYHMLKLKSINYYFQRLPLNSKVFGIF